ncbi:VOC family protein [Aliicoccus persicus]|uniref:Glyoxalase superfamily enzyme, possibly 3-demethylubiquinone-9 3-methyltransferase n=1 Tax=Aliicoccus persicus TaxID=930138 RepID=A0A662Z3W6_9STAP|nr:VOC family protein [Aliicoccus persicus]SEV86375.1 Glyoxalase superfamily enzyme, possibly 3-demethylubiquinone-9 3-methyltransferase [Aliicoccus persicus]
MNQKVVPHLWFETEAQEAAEFYTDIFPNSKILSRSTISDTPSGDAGQVVFEILGYRFMAISAGPYFTKNPAISFLIPFRSEEKDLIDEIWSKLLDGGKALMDLGDYPFSSKYGWVEDKYNVSWQLYLVDDKETFPPSTVVPTLTFTNDVVGKAEEAAKLYTDLFNSTNSLDMCYYPEGMEPNLTSHVMNGHFLLDAERFVVQDSAISHEFNFNEGISLMVNCEDQDEIDHFWNGLSAVPESEQCGWLKDQYGVSWQIVPKRMDEMLENGSEEQIKRVTEAFLKMKKFDLAELEKAYKG